MPGHPAPDTVSIIDLKASPPKVIAEVQAPASVVGPPQSVAVSSDESFALVTGAMKVDPADPKKVVPDNKLSVIDLKASPPAVTATLEAGAGAAGVSINPTGTLALVANRSEGTVSVFTVSGKTLTASGKIQLGDAKSGPSHVAFLPDGKSALVTRDGDHKISVLSVDGSKVEYTKRDMVGGIRPYSMEIAPKGDVAIVGYQGGGQGDNDVITVIDLKAQPPRIVDTISVGPTPEGVSMSPDGNYVAITVMNGSNRPKSLAVLQRLRHPEDLSDSRHQAVTGGGDQGRSLVPGRGLDSGRTYDPGAVHGREGAARLQLRRQGAQADRHGGREWRRGRHPHRAMAAVTEEIQAKPKPRASLRGAVATK